MGEEVTRNWNKLNNEKNHNVYSSTLLEWLRHRERDNEKMQTAKKWREIITKI